MVLTLASPPDQLHALLLVDDHLPVMHASTMMKSRLNRCQLEDGAVLPHALMPARD
jgi:hypothetical protein